jgi:hypothetical protein
MKIEEILHRNRDENSFTARLFEGILFPNWKNNPKTFAGFIDLINNKSCENLSFIVNKGKKTFIKKSNLPITLEYMDSRLFMEHVDICAALEKDYEDKTEFDTFILSKDENNNIHAIIFEVKCYSDLNSEEIERQNKILYDYKEKKLFYEFHHFALISYDNLINQRVAFSKNIDLFNGLYLVTWEDLKGFLFNVNERFSNADFILPKKISKNCELGPNRHLLKTREVAYYNC